MWAINVYIKNKDVAGGHWLFQSAGPRSWNSLMTVSRHYVNVFDRCKRVATSQGPFVRLKLRCTREFFALGAMNKYTYYYTGRQPLCFAADVKIFFSSPPILRGPSIDPHQTSPHVRRDPFFLNSVKKTSDFSSKNGLKQQNFGNLASWSRIHPE